MTHNPQTRPLTLTIIKPENNVTTQSIPNNTFPEFSHVPSNHGQYIATSYHNPDDYAYIERQKQLNRERQRRFKEKRQGFTDLINIDNINERMKQLWLLTYPDTYNHISSENLEVIIGQCVNSILASMNS